MLTTMHAEIIVDQLRETSDYRKQQLNAVAVMYDHIHVVVGVPGDPDPAELLRDYKSYASRALNARFGKPSSGTWWTASGSRRILKEDAALLSAIDYVRRQPNPLLLWCNES